MNNKIYITDNFCKDIRKIYGDFTKTDNELPALCTTVQGAAIFLECKEFPKEAITIRTRTMDGFNGTHPKVREMTINDLEKYDGKCRFVSTHIHPMDLPHPSSKDIAEYQKVRLDENSHNSFDKNHAIPFILINLHLGELEILGFWEMDGRCITGDVEKIEDNSLIIEEALKNAEQYPYYYAEVKFTRKLNNQLSEGYNFKNVISKNGKKCILFEGKNIKILFDWKEDQPEKLFYSKRIKKENVEY